MHTAHMILNSSEDWHAYLEIWEKLPPDVKRVGSKVGVEERCEYNFFIKDNTQGKAAASLACYV